MKGIFLFGRIESSESERGKINCPQANTFHCVNAPSGIMFNHREIQRNNKLEKRKTNTGNEIAGYFLAVLFSTINKFLYYF